MNGREITAAAIQMSSTPNKGENLETAERLICAAASSGAELVALPELWSCHGLEKVYKENSEPIPGPTTDFLSDLAHELGVYLLGGRSSKETLLAKDCIIHRRFSLLTARWLRSTARATSST